MKKIILLSAVSGVGKSTTCEYINNNHLLDDYIAFDIDELENINEYNDDTYNVFYTSAIKKAIEKSEGKNIIIGSCINPSDINGLDISKDFDISMILFTCSNEELIRRLKTRDESRNCSSDEFIKGQINYQNYMLSHLDMYQLHIDNTSSSIEDVSKQIVKYIKEKSSSKMKQLGTVTLESERLILRQCKESDYKDSFKYCCSDPELARLQAFEVHKNDEVTRRSFKEKEERYKVDKSFYEWAIIRKEDNQFMGEIALVQYDEKYNAIQLGYHLGKAFRGNGYMQEALNRILKFAFEELELDQVYALILNDNESSQKVVISNNLEYSRTIQDYKDDVYEGPIDKYKITKEKWFELNKKMHM